MYVGGEIVICMLEGISLNSSKLNSGIYTQHIKP